MKENIPIDAFISYSHSDSGVIAPEIQKGIENIGKPWYTFRRSLNVFRDETNLAASPELWPNIESALKKAKSFVLLASPLAAKSAWVTEEVNFWIQRFYQPEHGLQNFFIVLTEGTIEWDKSTQDFDWSKTDCLPAILSGKFKFEPLWINLKDYILQNQQKQKAINFRSAGFTRQVTKIIGAITGKDPRDVESDELQRTRNIKRFLTVLALTLVALLVSSVVLYFNEKDARNDAQAKQELAEKNLRDFEIEKFQRDIRNGNVYYSANEYCFAKTCFLAADSTARKYHDDGVIRLHNSQLRSRLDSCVAKCRE